MCAGWLAGLLARAHACLLLSVAACSLVSTRACCRTACTLTCVSTQLSTRSTTPTHSTHRPAHPQSHQPTPNTPKSTHHHHQHLQTCTHTHTHTQTNDTPDTHAPPPHTHTKKGASSAHTTAGPLTRRAACATCPPQTRAAGRSARWSAATPSRSAAALSGCFTAAGTCRQRSGRRSPSRPSWRPPAGAQARGC